MSADTPVRATSTKTKFASLDVAATLAEIDAVGTGVQLEGHVLVVAEVAPLAAVDADLDARQRMLWVHAEDVDPRVSRISKPPPV